jgi:hypothetical protein
VVELNSRADSQVERVLAGNADFPEFKVVNCDYTFDPSVPGVGAQWGGIQALECVLSR